MSDDILVLIQTMRAEQQARDIVVDEQLAKIHDLVNSQLTEAVNRFRDALKTIEELKALLGKKSPIRLGNQEGDAALAALEAKQGGASQPNSGTPDPEPDTSLEEIRRHGEQLIEEAKLVAERLVAQAEITAAALIDRQARDAASQRADRRRSFQ